VGELNAILWFTGGSASKPLTSIRDRAYACMEEYGVRVNCQEWPLTSSYSPVRTHSFGNRE
jgi:hypothetical protein